MKKPPPRTRMVMFRLTPEEYLAIERAAEATGARSLSEFAREALLGKTAQQQGKVQS